MAGLRQGCRRVAASPGPGAGKPGRGSKGIGPHEGFGVRWKHDKTAPAESSSIPLAKKFSVSEAFSACLRDRQANFYAYNSPLYLDCQLYSSFSVGGASTRVVCDPNQTPYAVSYGAQCIYHGRSSQHRHQSREEPRGCARMLRSEAGMSFN